MGRVYSARGKGHSCIARYISEVYAVVKAILSVFEVVVDGVHHALVTHTDAPLFITAFELLAARRAGIVGQIFQVWNDARV